MQTILIYFFVLADLGSIATGFLARKLAERSSSVERSRKVVTMIAASFLLGVRFREIRRLAQ